MDAFMGSLIICFLIIMLVYPKLKVRSQEQDVRFGGGSNPSLPGLKAVDSLFREDFSSSAKKETKPTSKKLETKVVSSQNLESITPLSASSDKNDRGEKEDIRPHIRASPIPRPRAVLSSPNNDDMIGSKTRRRTEDRTSALKPHLLGQKCNVTAKHSATGRPKSEHEVSKQVSNKSESRGNKVTVATTVKVRVNK